MIKETQEQRRLLLSIIITFVFMLVELFGGIYSNSLALISDGAHMLTDVGAMLLSYFAAILARRPSNLKMSFGYHRAEVIGAFVSGLILWIVSAFLIYGAFVRFRYPAEVKAGSVVIISGIGLLANIFSMKLLHSSQANNLNVRAAYLHLLSDLLGSVGAILAGVILWLTGWKPIDPMMTILFSGIMIVSCWSLMKESVDVLMQKTPRHLDPEAIQKDLEAHPKVEKVHDLHIWSVSSDRLALSAHLLCKKGGLSSLKPLHDLLNKKYGIHHSTLEIEDEIDSCGHHCPT